MIHNEDDTTIGPVTSQPQRCNIANIPNVSPGLEYLTNLDRLFVKNEFPCCLPREFFIKNGSKEDIYIGIDDDDCCRLGCSPQGMKVSDLHGNEVLRFTYFPGCMGSTFEVKTSSGQIIACVKFESTWCSSTTTVTNHNDETVLRLDRESFYKFKILTMDGDHVGSIKKLKYSGNFWNARYAMEINFDVNLDVHMKAALIAASLLIDAKQRAAMAGATAGGIAAVV
ncbi:phospholipid scramblase 2-like [Contarinia nasturtii]|uniref:phospholipid scramblase 2-like n=1 Tax=Contarinia nasturtii TaxID=265458 RepID=UPI0012D47AA4|nr:phospholipid scramblase 2-like [Contarinia nasturtii]XP_031637975.1 phospholipid scramblase 2-like [Contarinia nasturtii]